MTEPDPTQGDAEGPGVQRRLLDTRHGAPADAADLGEGSAEAGPSDSVDAEGSAPPQSHPVHSPPSSRPHPVRLPPSSTDDSTGSEPTRLEVPGDGGLRSSGVSPAAGARARHPLPRPSRTRILTVANQKGGVGKTTTAVNIAAALALHGLNVLVIDLDPQGNASTALGVDHHADVPSVYDVLVDGKAITDVVDPVDGYASLWCAPATIDLAGAEIELVSLVARESRLKRALDAFLAEPRQGSGRLDYVLIDCPPSLGLLTVNALVAAEEVLIPIQCEYYALEGLGQLLRNVDLVRSHLNPHLHVSTILLTMYDARTRLAAQVADDVRRHFAGTVLRTTIPRSVRISEAPSYGQTVMTYDPGSSGALSYQEAARELAEQAGTDAGPEETA